MGSCHKNVTCGSFFGDLRGEAGSFLTTVPFGDLIFGIFGNFCIFEPIYRMNVNDKFTIYKQLFLKRLKADRMLF